MKHVLVTGATGFIGSHLLNHLQKCDDFRLKGSYHKRLPPAGNTDVCWVNPGPLGPRTNWSESLHQVDVVVHTAALAHRACTKKADEFRRTNTEGTLRLAEEAARQRVSRFVFVSTIAVHGLHSSETTISEQTAEAPRSEYARSKLDAERGLLEIGGGMDIIIVRPPMVYGPHAPGNFRRLIQLVKSGLPLPFESLRNQRSLIGVQNLVSFLSACITHPIPVKGVYTVTDGEDISTPELMRIVAAALGKPARLFPMAPDLLHMLASMVGRTEDFQKLCGSLRIDDRKARAVFGWHAPFPARECLFAAARDSEP